ncbi:MAG: nodulation protein NfeD [Chloroflexota bacterium]|nr:nodulation protein NfeD [Chloroflexota bacterium]
MCKRLFPPIVSLLASLVLLVSSPFPRPALADGPHVDRVTINGPITPLTAAYLDRGIGAAESDGAACLVVEMDTPGGLSNAMDDMVKRMLAARVPIVVYVTPTGGRAASAGVFITLAGHVAAMAPGTRIGAAHPVGSGGEDLPESMKAKVTADMLASARNLAARRGAKASDWAESAVKESVSATEKEALGLGVIDLISPNIQALLADLDGRTVTTAAGTVTLPTRGLPVQDLPMSLGESFLQMLSDPNIAYVLMILGVNGLIFELSSPGAILPGVVGGICLLLAFYTLGTLPLNYAGLALIGFAFVLFVVDIKMPTHGLLTAGGVVSLLLGSLMLTSGAAPYLTISPWVILLVVAFTAAFFAFVVGKAILAQRHRAVTGREGLVGALGAVRQSQTIVGTVMVLVQGELWEATSSESLAAGDRVKVVAMDGLCLRVEKA